MERDAARDAELFGFALAMGLKLDFGHQAA
jgi:hypothetical protein